MDSQKGWSKPRQEVVVGESLGFQAGKIETICEKMGRYITHDPVVLRMVTGCKIEFDQVEAIRCHGVIGKQTYFVNVSEELDRIVQEFLDTRVIVELDVGEKVFVSLIFTVPKS